QGSLESAGIYTMLIDDNTVRIDWFLSNAVGGIKLQVDRADIEEAERVLTQPIPESLEVAGVGEYQQPHCPRCQSLDIAFQELDPAAYLTLALSVPVALHRRAWRCHSCQAEWEDDGIAATSEPLS